MTLSLRTILVVDDDPHFARLLALPLRFAYRVEVVTLAHEALMRLDATPERYRLVFTDLGMKPLGGEAIAASIRQDARLKHVHMIAASGDRDIAAKSAAAGFDDYISKPWEFDDIRRIAWQYFPLADEQRQVSCRKCGAPLLQIDNPAACPIAEDWWLIMRHVSACPAPDDAAF